MITTIAIDDEPLALQLVTGYIEKTPGLKLAGKFDNPLDAARVHRSFIVNLEKINTIERSRVVFGKEYIPVSDQYKVKFQEFLNKNFL